MSGGENLKEFCISEVGKQENLLSNSTQAWTHRGKAGYVNFMDKWLKSMVYIYMCALFPPEKILASILGS